MAEQPQVLRGGLIGHRGQALITGEVRLVDEAAQGVRDLPGPDRVRVGLGGILKVTQQVLAAELVADLAERVVGWAARRGPGNGPFPGQPPSKLSVHLSMH